MNQTNLKHILFEKRYTIKTLRPLWLVLPFLPLSAFAFSLNVFSYGLFGMGFLFLYFFPVWVVLYACIWIPVLLPDFFYPILIAIAICLGIGYCGYIAYSLDKKLNVISKQLSLISVSSIYLVVTIPLMLLFLFAAGIPASHDMPIHELNDQTHLWRDLKSYRDNYRFIDRQYFIRIEYEDGFVEECEEQFQLKPYELNDIPTTFWYKLILWWHPQETVDARAYISESFDFHNRGGDGDHFFFYVMPSERVCYIWYKDNF